MRSFGHKRPVRDAAKEIIELKLSPVCAVTRAELGGQFGSDKNRKLIVTLADGDLITIRPTGTRRPLSLEAKDVYRYMVRCEANKAVLERARVAKARKATRLESDRIRRADAKIKREARNQTT